MTRLILLDADRANGSTTPKPRFPDEMIASLRAGGAVIFPTDTLYGLGVDPCSETGLNRLLAAKGRDRGKPIPLLLSDRGTGRPLGAACSARRRPPHGPVLARGPHAGASRGSGCPPVRDRRGRHGGAARPRPPCPARVGGPAFRRCHGHVGQPVRESRCVEVGRRDRPGIHRGGRLDLVGGRPSTSFALPGYPRSRKNGGHSAFRERAPGRRRELPRVHRGADDRRPTGPVAGRGSPVSRHHRIPSERVTPWPK